MRVCSFGIFQIRINDPRLLGPWYTQGTDESSNRVDSQISSFDAA